MNEVQNDWKIIPFGRAKYKQGDRFGKLIIKYRTENQTGHTCYVCACDCGKFTKVLSCNLATGHTISCGCDNGSTVRKEKLVNHKNLKNKKIGDFIILQETKERYNGQIMWEVECRLCKKHYIKPSYDLQNQPYAQICSDCHPNDKYSGEIKIKEILNKNNISYQQQKSFNSCRFKDTNRLAKFDFFVNEKYLIEYDGKQHFECPSVWNEKSIKEHDLFKNNWCLENNIKLIRIPYYHLKDLTLADLIPEKSNFLVKKEIKND